MAPTPEQMQHRKTQRESTQIEFRTPVALEQIADALDFLRTDISEIKGILYAMLKAQQSR